MKKNVRNTTAGFLAIAAAMSVTSASAADAAPQPSQPDSAAASSSAAATNTAASYRMLSSTVAPQTSFDRFIVKYRDGAPARSNRSALLDAVKKAATRAGVGTKLSAGGTRSELGM